jgi:hypothetical protein
LNSDTASATPTELPDSDALSADGRAAESFNRGQLGILLAITALGAVLRLTGLEQWSLWGDEAFTWRDATMPLRGPNGFLATPQSWYPVSSLLLRALLDCDLLPSNGEGWLRLPFAFCGIVSVPLLALVGNPLVGRKAALLAALFLALHPWHIAWSQNARGYVLMFFCSCAAIGVFWRATGSGSRWRYALAILLVLLGGMCHPSGLLLLLPFVAYRLLSHGGALRNQRLLMRLLAFSLVAAGLAGIALQLPFLTSFARAKSDASLLHMVQTTAFYFRLPLLVTAVTGIWLLLQARLQGRVLFLACLLLVPILGAAASAMLVKVNARYAFCALPPVMLLCAAASVRMAGALQQGMAVGARWIPTLPALVLPAILCLDMASYDYLYFLTQHGDRGLWREAATFVTNALPKGKKLAVYTVNESSLLYYLRPYHFAEWPRDAYPDRDLHGIVSWEIQDDRGRDGGKCESGGAAYLRDAIQWAGQRDAELFVVVSLPELAEQDPDGSLRAALEQQLRLLKVFANWVGPKDESVYVYGSDPNR